MERKKFWEDTARRFGHDALAVVTAPTASGISNRIQDFFQNRSLAPFLTTLSKTMVLELGCGTGRWLVRGTRYGARMTGVDVSQNMLRLARLPERKYDLINGKVSDLPLRSNAFECVVSVTVLQHVFSERELAVTMMEMKRVLRPQGRVILLETALSDDVLKSVTKDYPTVLRSQRDWIGSMKRQGFSLVLVRPVCPHLGRLLLERIRRLLLRAQSTTEFYSLQLQSDLGGSKRVVKIAWEMAVSMMAILSFPADLALNSRIPRLSKHKVMIFQRQTGIETK